MNEITQERVLGRKLSLEELNLVAGGEACTPCQDGCSDENGNEVDCPDHFGC